MLGKTNASSISRQDLLVICRGRRGKGTVVTRGVVIINFRRKLLLKILFAQVPPINGERTRSENALGSLVIITRLFNVLTRTVQL